MLCLRPLCLAAALLLLAVASFAQVLDFGLSEPGCPAVTPDLLSAFATNAGEPGLRGGQGRC